MGRTIAIGDIHGCSRALDVLLRLVKPNRDDRLVALGDYVDRGPDSKSVLSRLIELGGTCELVPLMGNHEAMFLDALEGGPASMIWEYCGGRETLHSYGGSLKKIPLEHRQFIGACQPSLETSTHIFVHANYDPLLPMSEQPEHLLYWQHLQDPPTPRHRSGKTAIVGHTPQVAGSPLFLPHLICLDTFCFGGGWLTACDLDSGELWQANQLGQHRWENLATLE